MNACDPATPPTLRRRAVALFALCAAALCLTGCAQYEFNIVAPPEFAAHIGEHPDTIVSMAPIEYHFFADEGRLVAVVRNLSDAPLTLDSPPGYIVDADGESHTFASQGIGPGAYIRLVFPPFHPIYHPYPFWDFGFGVGFGHIHRYGRYHRFDDPFDHSFYGETYYSYEDEPSRHWSWDDESASTFHFVYRHDDRTFTHDFVIQRVKMK